MINNDLIPANEAALFLRIKPKTLANWRSTGIVEIPYIKIGGKVIYRMSDLEEFLNNNRIDKEK